MRPETSKFLKDMLDAADRILDYTIGKTRDDFLSDGKLRDAVQWNSQSSARRLPRLEKSDPVTAHQINEWRRIIAFRNQLIHGYGVVKHEITWDIVQNKLPILKGDIQSLLPKA